MSCCSRHCRITDITKGISSKHNHRPGQFPSRCPISGRSRDTSTCRQCECKRGQRNFAGDFSKKRKTETGSKVNRDTVSRALTGVRKQYQKKERLEAAISLQSKEFQPPINHVDYAFAANQGPIVKIFVNGTKLSRGKIRNLVPVYQEGSVDEDLLNEGNKRIRDYYQREGYFDVQVTHDHVESSNGPTIITYTVKLGVRHRVESVQVSGNKYFNTM